MRANAIVATAVVSFWFCSPLQANKYGSVEPIANPAVIDTSPLRDQPLRVREAFATRLLQCGIVDRVVQALSATRAITTINDLNTHFSVGAGGFAGATPPPLAASAALFETVGRIDPELFATDTSGYTQYGRAYLSLQSAVSDDQFIRGYVRAAAAVGVEYTPVINGMPSLFQGGAAFPGNDWTVSTRGEEYLSRIPARSHHALARIRAFHLRVTREVLRRIEHDRRSFADVASFDCH